MSPPQDKYAVSRGRLVKDSLARWIVSAGGLGIIVSILGILVFLIVEALPLTQGAAVEDRAKGDLAAAKGQAAKALDDALQALGGDTYLSYVAGLGADAQLRLWKVERATDTPQGSVPGGDENLAEVTGKVTGFRLDKTIDVLAGDDAKQRPKLVDTQLVGDGAAFAAATTDGRGLIVPVAWDDDQSSGKRIIVPKVEDSIRFRLLAKNEAPQAFGISYKPGGGAIAVAQAKDGTLSLVKVDIEINDFTEEKEISIDRKGVVVEKPIPFVDMLVDVRRENVYAATADGRMFWWDILRNEFTLEKAQIVTTNGVMPSRLSFLFAEQSVILGGSEGQLSVWFPVRENDDSEKRVLTRIREFEPLASRVHRIVASRRNKSFLAASETGHIGLYYSTTGKQDWTAKSRVGKPSAISLGEKMDHMLVAGGGELSLLALDNPHPDSSFSVFFSKVWYEGYNGEEFVWQSSSGTDEFEPKLSLMPLIFGTLKGTIFSMLLSIPIAVLGAMFTSHFMSAGLKRYIKPMIEIMAAMPSVILGFVAAMWLAPILEAGFCAFMIMPLMIPLVIILTGWLGSSFLPLGFRAKFPFGFEAFAFCVAVVVGFWLCVQLNDPIENAFFAGDLPSFIGQVTGKPYEQKNAIVIAMAMSFAVVPIIFSISEEAFSNVPRNLVSGSLALGANRWQTVTRVVLPTASPGIFSAVMVGFGRAVGETMIVLMATGNTPIMEWNPFNGFRTLSANIAVEIPEAPIGGTLYRTLFLAALMLYGLTFAINTVAEVIRHRLRRRYSGAS